MVGSKRTEVRGCILVKTLVRPKALTPLYILFLYCWISWTYISAILLLSLVLDEQVPLLLQEVLRGKKNVYIKSGIKNNLHHIFYLYKLYRLFFFVFFVFTLRLRRRGGWRGGWSFTQRNGGERKWRTQVYQMKSKLRHRLSYSYLEDMQDEVEIWMNPYALAGGRGGGILTQGAFVLWAQTCKIWSF